VNPKDVTHVIYHAQCPDGSGAAWAAYRLLGDAATYIPVQHGDKVPALPKNAVVAMVDFAFPREALIELKKSVKDLIVLDHHLTAEKDLAGLSFATFDMNKSGAVLAWEFFHPKEDVPELLLYIQDSDLWRLKLPETMEVRAALRSYGHDFKTWDRFEFVSNLAHEGKHILRYQNQLVDNMTQEARLVRVGDYTVPAVNATCCWSEVANALCKKFPDAPFAAAWYERPDGIRVWSLRSIGDFDVSVVAKALGGGGHKNAAGFRSKS